MIQKCSALIVLAMLLGGCAGFTGSSQEMEAMFATRITGDGAKLFDYTVHLSPEFNSLSQTAQKDGKGPWNKTDRLVYTMLDNEIAITGYCRDGYIELDSNIADSLYQISGECYEIATMEDRAYFAAR